MVRMRADPRTQAYVQRRTQEGLSSKEIQRCLKRYIVRELYPLIVADLACSADLPWHRSVNLVIERFYLSLKMERVWCRDYANHAEVICDTTEYIVGVYNNERLRSKPGYLSPAVYERTMASKSPIEVSGTS